MFAVIEDDRVSQEFICRLIKSVSESEIFRYSTAEAFIRDIKIKNLSPKIIFLDVTLPGMTGLEALANIKGIDGFEKTPVIMCTSSQDKKIILQSIKAGAANYLVKPAAQDTVQKIIKAYT